MGRLTLRLPDALHEELRAEADRQHVSLNTALVSAATAWLEHVRATEWPKEERDAGTIHAARSILAERGRDTVDPEAAKQEEEAAQRAAQIVRDHRRTQQDD